MATEETGAAAGAPDNAQVTGQRKPARSQAGDAVYGLGFIGALVWFWRQADGGNERAVAVLKALIWPAFLVHDAFKALGRDARNS